MKKNCKSCKFFNSQHSSCDWLFSQVNKVPEWLWIEQHNVYRYNGEYCPTWAEKIDNSQNILYNTD